MTVRLDDSLETALREFAAARGRRPDEVVGDAVREYLGTKRNGSGQATNGKSDAIGRINQVRNLSGRIAAPVLAPEALRRESIYEDRA